MARRFQPNRRRGLLRAAAVVAGLVVLLLIVAFVVSSLTAPAVKAPTAPATPPPVTPTVPRTPGTAAPKATSGVRPPKSTVAPRATAKSTKAPDFSGRSLFGHVTKVRELPANASLGPDGHTVAYIHSLGNAYAANPLLVGALGSGRARSLATADPFVRPVWSNGGRFLLYERVAAISTLPGARWTLLRLDTRSGRSTIVTRQNALNVLPLGWRQDHPLYLVAQGTNSSVFVQTERGPVDIAPILSQPITAALLSPNGRYLAAAAPANCAPCSLDLFDLSTNTPLGSYWGMANDSTMSWNRAGRLIAEVNGGLLEIDPRSSNVRHFSLPNDLPRRWSHPLDAAVTGAQLVLRDPIAGIAYRGHAQA